MVSPVLPPLVRLVVGVLGWFGPVGGQAFFQLGQHTPRPAGPTIRAWQRREHRLRRDQAHPLGRSPRAERARDRAFRHHDGVARTSCLLGLILITGVNLWGIGESARVLTLPMVAFLSAIFGVLRGGLR